MHECFPVLVAQSERLHDRVQIGIRMASGIVESDDLVKGPEAAVVHVGASDC